MATGERARGRTEQVMARRFVDGVGKRTPDRVVVEEPMEIRLDDHLVATTMRTPGHDFELAVGFLRGAGLLPVGGVNAIRYCGTGSAVDTDFNVVSVGSVVPNAEPQAALTDRLAPLPNGATPAPAVLGNLADAVRADQPLFDQTGAVHGAAAFTIVDGSVLVVREDVGRLNAVDKVVGRLELDGRLPATNLGLFVSGRASVEVVQKARAAGFGCVVAVGGPSSLALRTAKTAHLPLVAFARGDAWTDFETGP